MSAANAAQRTVYLVDPDLHGTLGHYLDYALAVYHEARARGDSFLALVPTCASEAVRAALPTRPAFRRRHGGAEPAGRLPHSLRMLGKLGAESMAAFADLRRAARSLPAGPSVFFFPNPSTMDLLGFVAWILSRPADDEASYVILLRWDHHVRGRRAVHRALLKAAFGLLRGRRGVRIVSDSAPLARSYAELAGMPVEVLPIPHAEPGAGGAAAPARGGAGRPCHLVYVGGWRTEQGVGDLADALIAMRGDFAEGRFTATIQARASSVDPQAAAVQRRLKAAAIPGVEIVEEVLSRERFLGCLAAADFVVVPYQVEAYRYRTSGIFAEAVALGKPVITTRESWMAGELGGDEALLYTSGSPDDLVRTLRGAAGLLPELGARAARRRSAWNAFHNPATFYGLLVGDTRQGAATARATQVPHEVRRAG
ncbi:MAG TPA: glycosyltransferase [Longimicrobium sp.]|jgi:glycosyltransferase involved in cell wall biosynthesis